ncbi:hypothetical protein GTY20_14340 [Streptomyces sp. SID4946]|uniref:hypothetical protein n=1 Tax=Streptomyces sp. LamerLS-31b TaxID=1839765 RepID=UPI00136EE545|nr:MULTISPECIES: hypothetical protein [unclassified Streptomyces]MYQ92435.1 hypothetical protein [Streptomyces sp. SID4946]
MTGRPWAPATRPSGPSISTAAPSPPSVRETRSGFFVPGVVNRSPMTMSPSPPGSAA